jgi:hypothetical protein
VASARFCAQASELGIAEGRHEKTALEDILGGERTRITDDRLDRALDGHQRNQHRVFARTQSSISSARPSATCACASWPNPKKTPLCSWPTLASPLATPKLSKM